MNSLRSSSIRMFSRINGFHSLRFTGALQLTYPTLWSSTSRHFANTTGLLSDTTSLPQVSGQIEENQDGRPKLSYHVTRTQTNNLPVYVDIKSGGTRIETMIRRVHGDSLALLKDVSNDLGLKDIKAYVKQPTGHVIFAGRHKEQIVEFLLKRGF